MRLRGFDRAATTNQIAHTASPPTLAKNARMGHPRSNGTSRNHERWATRLVPSLTGLVHSLAQLPGAEGAGLLSDAPNGAWPKTRLGEMRLFSRFGKNVVKALKAGFLSQLADSLGEIHLANVTHLPYAV